MRVLYIINSLHTGGAEKLVIDVVPLLVKKGYVVDLLLLNGTNTPFLKKFRDIGCSNIISLGNSYYNPLYIFRIIPYLRKYDLIHVHLFPAMYFVALAKVLSFSKTKIVFTEHSTLNRRLQHRIYFPLERFIYSIYSSVICITNSVKTTLQDKLKICRNKLHVIENGIDICFIKSTIAHTKATFGFSESDKIICMVAGFRREKDQDTVVKTLKLLPNGYKLIFIGTGDRLEEVKALTRTLEVFERITFLGVRTDVISLIKMCDIAVLSSHWEGFGLAAVEAMACGIPLIASDVKGLEEVVADGGLIFEKGNARDLANKIKLLEDPLVYKMICTKGIKKAEDYNLTIMIDKIIALYSFIFYAR